MSLCRHTMTYWAHEQGTTSQKRHTNHDPHLDPSLFIHFTQSTPREYGRTDADYDTEGMPLHVSLVGVQCTLK